MGGGPDGTFTMPGERAKAAAEQGGSLRGRNVGGLPRGCSGQSWAFGGKPQEALAEVGVSGCSETRELTDLRGQVHLCMSPSEQVSVPGGERDDCSAGFPVSQKPVFSVP